MKVTNHSKIYEVVLSHCVPLEVNGPWGRFAADVDAWTLASSPQEVLNSLQNNDSDEEPAGDSNQDAVAYSEEDLVTSHAAFRLHNGTLALSPRLTGPESVIVPLRVQPTELPYDLLVADGTLSRNLPVCATLQDGVLQALIEAVGALLVTFSIDDLVVLRLAGLPAITAAGLPNLARGALDLFCKTYGLRDSAAPSDSDPDQPEADQAEVDFGAVADAIQDEEPSTAGPADSAGAATKPPQLIFVNWTPSKLECTSPEEVESLRFRFRELEKYLGLSFENMSLWTPTPEDVARVRFCLEKATCEDVRAAIQDSLDERQFEITADAENSAAAPELIEVLARLRTALRRRQGNRKRERRLWAEYEAVLESQLVTPMVRWALEVMDPVERSRLLAIAGINRVVHPAAEVLLANLARRIAKAGIRKAGATLGSDLEPLLKFYTILLNLIKAGK